MLDFGVLIFVFILMLALYLGFRPKDEILNVNSNLNLSTEEENEIKTVNNNIFSYKGRIRRLGYFLNTAMTACSVLLICYINALVIGLLCTISAAPDNYAALDRAFAIAFWVNLFFVIIGIVLTIFNIKKRLFDITENKKLSISVSIAYVVIANLLGIVNDLKIYNPTWLYLPLAFLILGTGLWILFAPSNKKSIIKKQD